MIAIALLGVGLRSLAVQFFFKSSNDRGGDRPRGDGSTSTTSATPSIIGGLDGSTGGAMASTGGAASPSFSGALSDPNVAVMDGPKSAMMADLTAMLACSGLPSVLRDRMRRA